MKKKIILMLCMALFVACLFAISVSAVVIDGIDYSFQGETATVTNVNKGCQLTVVNIPEMVTYGENTYTVTAIANSAFRDNGVVTSVTTPSTIDSIGEHAFRSMSALKTVTLNASEKFKCFSDAEFWGNKALVSIDMSGCMGLTGLGNGGTYDDTFDGCTMLEKVVLPDGINYIGRQVFFNCSKLTTIENLDFTKVTYVGYKAFWGPKIGGDVILSENATYVGSHAFRETNITSIVIRAGENCTQTTFDDATFYGCKQLKYAVLPNTLETVGQYTFSGCTSLEYVVLGDNIRSFSTTSTFSGCGALKAIIYKGSQAEFNAMSGISCLGTVAMVDFASYEHGTLPSTRTVYYGATTCPNCNGLFAKTDNPCVGDCTHCGALNVPKANPVHNIVTSITYASFDKEGVKTVTCVNEGCAHAITQAAPALFTCSGYSTPENGKDGIAISFTVNNEAIKEYEQITGKTLTYGVFAVSKANLGTNDIFDKDGKASSGVINAEITGYEFASFDLRICGFEEKHKSELLAMGAYVIVSDNEATDAPAEYSYLQASAPNAGEKYAFVSYNDIVGNPSTDEEVTK